MKVARFVLKIVAASLAFAAAVCCVIAYWDKLTDVFYTVKESAAERRAARNRPAEYDDYADVEDFEF
ncbi:MAG: hypothetical protein HFF18_04550 [Oscillospiraceae bacterium]|nr:hypothetical protein [Oscillospiraceae bacterium]